MALAPIMIYGDDVTHLLTEEGIAYLYKARSMQEREEMIAAVAGVTDIGLNHNPKTTERLRQEGLVVFPEDLGYAVLMQHANYWLPKILQSLCPRQMAYINHLQNSGAGNNGCFNRNFFDCGRAAG